MNILAKTIIKEVSCYNNFLRRDVIDRSLESTRIKDKLKMKSEFRKLNKSGIIVKDDKGFYKVNRYTDLEIIADTRSHV